MIKYGELRQQQRIPLEAAIPLAVPLTLYVEPTNVCNLACKECPESLGDRFFEIQGGKFHLRIADWDTLAEKIRELGRVKTMNFHMLGEPLLNVNTPYFIAEANRLGLADRTILTTNGTFLSERVCRELVEAGLDYLRVSLYPESYSRAAEGVKRLREIRDEMHRANPQSRNGMATKPWIYVKGFPEIAFTHDFRHRFEGVADEVAVEELMNWNGEGSDFGPSALGKRHRACPSPFFTMVVHADLRVSPCCVDWNKQLVIGDLRKESLVDVWRGERLRKLQNSMLVHGASEVCKSCDYYHLFPDSDNVDSVTVDKLELRRLQQCK